MIINQLTGKPDAFRHLDYESAIRPHGRYEEVYNTWIELTDMSIKVSLEI